MIVKEKIPVENNEKISKQKIEICIAAEFDAHIVFACYSVYF